MVSTFTELIRVLLSLLSGLIWDIQFLYMLERLDLGIAEKSGFVWLGIFWLVGWVFGWFWFRFGWFFFVEIGIKLHRNTEFSKACEN